MKLYEALQNIRMFLLELRIKIKLLSETDFEKLLKDKSLDYTQKLYLCYFRYMQFVRNKIKPLPAIKTEDSR